MAKDQNQPSTINNHTSFGPSNPHPLSQMRTELVWEGKYDEFGKRREGDIAACAMPMQRIETVDEPRQRAAADPLSVTVRSARFLPLPRTDDDGAWPYTPVRNLLERLQSEELERGLQVGVANKRSAHTVISGGVQELALAARFKGYSKPLQARWLRTATVPVSIAERFRNEAKWHQDREQFEKFE